MLKTDVNVLIDDMDPILWQYPFVRLDRTMTMKEFEMERKYYGEHLEDLEEGTYKPLWKQK